MLLTITYSGKADSGGGLFDYVNVLEELLIVLDLST